MTLTEQVKKIIKEKFTLCWKGEYSYHFIHNENPTLQLTIYKTISSDTYWVGNNIFFGHFLSVTEFIKRFE